MADAICIWTPMGLKCSASPVKTHYADRPCVEEHGPGADVRRTIIRRQRETAAALDYWLHLSWDDPDWSLAWDRVPPGQQTVYARALEIARVVELMYAVELEADTLFSVQKLKHVPAQ